MLRVTTHDLAPVTSFVLEGKLVGPWVKELEKCWESTSAADRSRAMLVNLADVTFIDSEGRALLARMRRGGARLLSTGVLINAIVAEIEAEEGPNNGRRQQFQARLRKRRRRPAPSVSTLVRISL